MPTIFEITLLPSGEPAYEQIARQVRAALGAGTLRPQDRLPTVRALARRLNVDPNTVARAYRELRRDDLLHASPGRGTFVRALPPPLPVAEQRRRLRPLVERLVSEGRLIGATEFEIRSLVQSALRAAKRPPRSSITPGSRP
jgi:GntR family transcriptional regulator